MFEHDAVAQHHIRAGEPRHLVVGVVPRHDAEQYPNRAPFDHRAAPAVEQVDGLVGQESFGVIGVVVIDCGAEVHLTQRLVNWLAHFAVDDLGQLLPALGVQLGDLFDQCRTLGHRRLLRPLPEGRVGSCQRLFDLCVGCCRVLPLHLAGRRIDYCVHVHGGALPVRSSGVKCWRGQRSARIPANTSKPSISSSSLMVSGGRKRSTFPNVPQLKTMTPCE